ncbi:DNA-binding transcriptional regulator, MerR family [Ruania alba]|uniref:DNA-binding transcriptional regulator, MerR family n=2 Tax=Ruania alba TaxID=648782 RepID=A0A1H5LNZ2_9MICO|nr:DNA-binding transcriptional regulator, MerR family [Ruania alba]
MQMLIGELAEYVGTSPRSLRHYEQQGLLSPERGANGYRVYDETDVIRAVNVKELFDAGLTSADVRQYLVAGCLDQPLMAAPRCSAELETVRQRLASVDELIGRLERTRERLVERSRGLEDELDVG